MTFTDRELIEQIKTTPKDDLVVELVNRHTGIYIQIVDKYSNLSSGFINKQDLIDQRYTNIYAYALDYDPKRNMKFSSYVGQRIKWECQGLLHRCPTKEDVEQQIIEAELDSDDNDHELQTDEQKEVAQELLRLAQEAKNIKFADVIKHRFFGDKILSWRGIGKKMNLSHEGVRKIYLSGLKQIKKEYHE